MYHHLYRYYVSSSSPSCTGGARGAIPVEFTPLYCGIPVQHKTDKCDIGE